MAHQQAVLAGRTSTVLPTPEVATLRCEGELGELELAALGDELFRLVNRGSRCLVIDLSGVDHIDYRGVRPLAARARALRSSGGDLKLAGLSAYLAAIFRAAGVEQEFELYRTGEEARSAFAHRQWSGQYCSPRA